MLRILLHLTLVTVIIGIPNVLNAGNQNRIVKNLDEGWRVQDEYSSHFVPLADTESYHTIHCELDLNPYTQFDLELRIPSKHSIYINNQLVFLSKEAGKVVWSIDSLAEIYRGSKTILSIYNSILDVKFISSLIVKKTGDRSSQFETSLTWNYRENAYGMNILTLSSFIILSLIVIYRTTYYKLFNEYFSISRATMVRQRFDLIGAHGPFSLVTLGVTFLYALMIGATLQNLKLINLWSIDYLGGFILSDNPLVYGSQITCAAFLLMMLKYPLVAAIASIFSFQKFSEIHYFAYLRISLISILVILGVSVMVSIVTDEWTQWTWVVCQFLILGILLSRLVFIFFILNNKYNFSKLHLFAYLCSSEIIPLCLFVKSLLG